MAFGDDPFGLYHAQVEKLLTDTGTTGPTFDTAIDFRAAQEVSFEPEEGDRVDAEGDDTIVASSLTAGAMRGTVRGSGWPYPAIVMLYGLEVVTSGSTPNQTVTYYEIQGATKPHFRLRGLAVAKQGGALEVGFLKAQADGDLPPFALTGGEFGSSEVPFTAYWTDSTTSINSTARKLRVYQKRWETAPAA